VADFNGDGRADIAVGGVSPLAWYRSPTWERRVIATPSDEFTTDMQAGDVDGDGDPDIVVPDGATGMISWFENPRPGGDPFAAPWPRHPIGSHGTYAHDIEVGPFGAAGRLGVVSRAGGIAKLWHQTAPDVWAETTIVMHAGEGVGLGDIDGDGDLDVAIGAAWLENPGGGLEGPWQEWPVTQLFPELVGVRVANINGDGRPDIVISASESAGRMSWFEAPADPRGGEWTERTIDPSVEYVHTFQVADVNRDGRLDVVFAEMLQSSRDRVGYFLNPGGTGQWPITVVDTAGSHNIRIGDLLGNGRLGIVGANWQGPPVTAWIDRAPAECYANCDGSTIQPIRNVNDFVCFQSRFAAGDTYANCDGSTAPPVLNVSDFLCFLNRYAAGCSN
jgi:hypothetical protein